MPTKCILKVDDRLFCVEAILKTSYLFIDNYYISNIYTGEHEISISIESKKQSDLTNIDKEFSNELIAQMVRYNLSKTNKPMKELILGRALFSTFIDTVESESQSDDLPLLEYSLDDIAVDWFESESSDAK